MSHGNLQKYQSKNSLQNYLLERFLQQVVSLAADAQPDSVLDIGCAEGFVLNRIRKHVRNCTGIDCDEQALSRGRVLHPGLDLRTGNAEKMPFEDNSFDFVLCTEVLEHVENPGQVLAELVRVSRKWVLVSTPHEPWFCLANLLRGKNIRRFGNDPEHINHWTGRGLSRFLRRDCLRIVQAKHSFPWLLRLAEKQGA